MTRTIPNRRPWPLRHVGALAAMAAMVAVTTQAVAQPAEPAPMAAGQTEQQDQAERELKHARMLANIAEYASAADRLRGFARRYAKHPSASKALTDAAKYYLALGMHQHADNAVNDFLRLYGRRDPATYGALLLALATSELEHGAVKQAHARVKRWLRGNGRRASAKLRIRGEVLHARSLELLGRHDDALRQHRAIAKRGAAMVQDKTFLGDSRQSQRMAAKALNALGEAHYQLAMVEYRKVLAMKPPRAPQRMTRAKLNEYVNRKIKPWLMRRRQVLNRAERAFLQVAKMKPVPPPSWVIQSAARVADMWNDTYRLYHEFPTPKLSPAERQAYRAALATAGAPIRDHAVGALRQCVRYGARYQHEATQVAACERDLAKLLPRQVVALEELTPQLLHVSNTSRLRTTQQRQVALADPRK